MTTSSKHHLVKQPGPELELADKDGNEGGMQDWCDEKNTEDRSSSTTGGSDTGILLQSMNIEKTAKLNLLVAFLVVLVGGIASTSFLYLGISNEKNSKDVAFDRRSKDLGKELQGAMSDYELAASWIHESCRLWREEDITSENFRVLYDYIRDGDLDFYAMEWYVTVGHVLSDWQTENMIRTFTHHPNC